jgi:hypothetical protein
MDKIKNAVSGSSGSKDHGNNNAQKEDYLDKGLDAAEQKWGGMSKEDTQRHRETNEKIVCSPYHLEKVM